MRLRCREAVRLGPWLPAAGESRLWCWPGGTTLTALAAVPADPAHQPGLAVRMTSSEAAPGRRPARAGSLSEGLRGRS